MVLIWLPRIIPLYCMCGGIVNISLKDSIANTREKKYLTQLDMNVAGGDVMFLVLHFFFWNLMLIPY